MVLPGSGLIKFSDLQTEFGGTNPILMSEYSTQTGVAANAFVRMGTNFHGKSAQAQQAPATPVKYPPSAPSWAANGTITSYNGGSSTIYSGTVSGQAYGNGAYTLKTNDQGGRPISQAFDGSTSVQWTTAGRFTTNTDTSPTGWFTIQLPNPIILSSYTFRYFGVRARPTKWILYGSSDEVTFTQIESRTGVTYPTNPITLTITGNSTAYSIYKFEFYRVNAPSDPVWPCELTEVELYGTESGSSIPSVGLSAWYDGNSYVSGTKWVNKSGDTSNDIPSSSFENIANTTVNTHANGWKFLSGPASAGGIFTPLSLTTTYTLFHVAKYNGTNKGRIFDANWGASPQNWLSGFHGGNAGVAFHLGWITNYTNLHGTNWVLSSDQNDPPLYRSNGVNRTLGNVSANKLTTPASLAISVNERSDWAVAEFILYTRTLTLAEIQTVEAYLRNKYIGASM